MNDTLRHLLIFIIILGTGTPLIILDLPLIFILVLEAFIGFLLLVLLSPGFGADLKASVPDLLKISFIRRDRGNKPLFKIPVLKQPAPKKPEPLFVIEKEKVIPAPKRPSGSSIRAFFARFTIRKPADTKKPAGTGRSPDTMAGKNVDVSALALAGELGGDTGIKGMDSGTGRGARGSGPLPVEDPFLSLSSDELETGLLDSFDPADLEPETAPAPAPEGATPLPDSPPIMDATSGLTIGEADIPLPPQEISDEPAEGREATGPEPEEYYGLDGSDTIDQNFGEFEDAEITGMEPDERVAREGAGPGTTVQPPPLEPTEPVPETLQPAPAPAAGSPALLFPAGGTLPAQPAAGQQDMAIFTAPESADDEMVRSLASDAKTTKKGKDASLLRELKDFNAPATDIEGELNEIFSELNASADKKTKTKIS
jgi:hypothetical protein